MVCLYSSLPVSYTCLYLAGKYWFPGHLPPMSPGYPLKILFDNPQDVMIWRPRNVMKWQPMDVLMWRSREVPERLIQGIPKTLSGRSLEDLQSTQTWMSQFFLNCSFRTYSIDQIYLKAFQHLRWIENRVKLLRWSIFWKIS